MDTNELQNAAFHNGPFGFGTPENAAFVKGVEWALQRRVASHPDDLIQAFKRNSQSLTYQFDLYERGWRDAEAAHMVKQD